MFDISITPDQLTSQEFKDKVAWVVANGAPPSPAVSFLSDEGPGLQNSPLPPDSGTWVLTFSVAKGKSYVVSAGLTFQHPEITLIILGEVFGFPVPASVIPYRPAAVPPPQPAPNVLVPSWKPGMSPIGPEILPMHPGHYAPLDGDRYPVGSPYFDPTTSTTYVKKGWGVGLFGGGSTWWEKAQL